MKLDCVLDDFAYRGNKLYKPQENPTKIPPLYKNDAHYEKMMEEFREEIDELQTMMYAHNRYAMLLIFQAMDAAGKDSTIKHVLSGVNPMGVRIYSFKRPTEPELDHDYMWRSQIQMPPRGTLGIFNRSYYEEVLVTKVHPQLITQYQQLPHELQKDMDKLFEHRYEDIVHQERYYYRNGIRIIKFFLNVSKAEQAKRLLKRLDDPKKNWKFEKQDIAERTHWAAYQAAYEQALNATATEYAPWYVIPADDKKNMRLMVSKILLHEMQQMHLHYPISRALPPQEIEALKNQIREQERN